MGGFVRDDSTSCQGGQWSIVMQHEGDDSPGYRAYNHVIIHQEEATPLTIEGWSKAEDVSGEEDQSYSLLADVTFTDGSKSTGNFIPFSTGTHDWECKAFLFDPKDKPVKEMDLWCVWEGRSGRVWFDTISVNQAESKQFVKNPSFELSDPSTGVSHWEPQGKGFVKDIHEFCFFGHTR